MATYYSKAARSEQAADVLLPGVSLVRTALYQNTSGTALAAASIIQMAPVPKDAMVTNIILRWSGVSGLDVNVGDGDDPDRYLAALDLGTAAGQASMIGHTSANDAAIAAHHVYSDEDTVDIVIHGATTWADDGYITMDVEYKMAGLLKGETKQDLTPV